MSVLDALSAKSPPSWATKSQQFSFSSLKLNRSNSCGLIQVICRFHQRAESLKFLKHTLASTTSMPLDFLILLVASLQIKFAQFQLEKRGDISKKSSLPSFSLKREGYTKVCAICTAGLLSPAGGKTLLPLISFV